MIRLADRQGLLKGDLNVVQQIALAWLIGEEITEQAEVERLRFLNHALGANQYTSPDYIKGLIKETEKAEADDPEWIMPQSQEELDGLIRDLGFS